MRPEARTATAAPATSAATPRLAAAGDRGRARGADGHRHRHQQGAVEGAGGEHQPEQEAGGGPAQRRPGGRPGRRAVEAGVAVGERQGDRREAHQEEVGVGPEDVGEGDGGEDRDGHPERGGGAEAALEGARRQDGGQGEQQGVGDRGAAQRREAHEGGDPQGVGGGLGVDEGASAVAALEDQPVGFAAPVRDEAVVVPPRVADVEVPGQALGLHEVGGLVADQSRPAPPVEGEGPRQRRRQEQAEHGPAPEALHGAGL